METPVQKAFQGRLIAVEVRGPYEVVVHPGAVAVVAQNEQGKLLLVRQEREGAGKALWEIPAGVREPGEKPLAAAQRELAEETGLRARTWRFLAVLYPTPGYSTERIYLFLAQGLEGAPLARSEIAEVGFFSPAEILRWAHRGLGDAKTLAALSFLAYPRL